MKKTIAFGVLFEDFFKLLRHRQAVFALVTHEFDVDDVAGNNAQALPLLFIDDDVKYLAPRQQRTLKAFRAVDRADHTLKLVLKSKLGNEIACHKQEVPP